MDSDPAHADLYPRFTTDADGNIIAYSNGHATTIIHANRRADAHSERDPDRNENQHDDPRTQSDADAPTPRDRG